MICYCDYSDLFLMFLFGLDSLLEMCLYLIHYGDIVISVSSGDRVYINSYHTIFKGKNGLLLSFE